MYIEIAIVVCITIVILALIYAFVYIYELRYDSPKYTSSSELKRMQEQCNNLYSMICELENKIK